MKRLWTAVALLAALAVALTSCTEQSGPTAPENAPMSVTISITGYDNEILLSQEEVGIFEDTTVLDVLIYISNENDIALDYSGSGQTAYVKGIANLYEFDYGPESGWIYAIDDGGQTVPTVGCGDYTLSDNDSIQWIYVTATPSL